MVRRCGGRTKLSRAFCERIAVATVVLSVRTGMSPDKVGWNVNMYGYPRRWKGGRGLEEKKEGIKIRRAESSLSVGVDQRKAAAAEEEGKIAKLLTDECGHLQNRGTNKGPRKSVDQTSSVKTEVPKLTRGAKGSGEFEGTNWPGNATRRIR